MKVAELIKALQHSVEAPGDLDIDVCVVIELIRDLQYIVEVSGDLDIDISWDKSKCKLVRYINRNPGKS